ncbi:two-component system, NtrC family, sensor kinase [Roseovarius lutimaris]|uniref:histidine kinase n=1 Tax=Roseovarius lutimaris TaxID=1005928 RepID=A0A1I5A6E0_9RHOB|nr:cache domain-containing protein [Roseovarius lutimaris]SFN58023.1 two-component system, NtrC family, sensor kinase [Roseovarius lutimaris]
MTSVRLRLLILALLPLMVLMPLLLLFAVNRWSVNYDNLLITNVQSDLRIADQYLQRILTTTGNDVRSLARSIDFDRASGHDPDRFNRFLQNNRAVLGLDFLYFLPAPAAREQANLWPVIAAAVRGGSATEIDILSGADLAALPSATGLAARARVPLVETRAAVPTKRTTEDRGMVVHTATAVTAQGRSGVLVGGILLNRNLDFIDTINALVYRATGDGDARKGTATLFLEDVRISTNVRLFEGERALGTRVSAAVRGAVLDGGRTWLDSAFVVNDWYISAYEPLTDSFGNRVGMLYVGFLEAPFTAVKRSAYILIFTAFLAILALTIPLFLRLAGGIFSPLERMTQTMRKVESGQLDARIGPVRSRDEIGTVAAHLDSLLDQVQERDRALRSWADVLNTRVEERTAELREANQKLEATYQQLVMSEKLASIGEITAGVAHEINNPVAVIQGNVDVIRQTLGKESAPVDTELSLIDRQVGRISAIVSKLLQFARPTEFGTFEEQVDIAAVLKDCLVLVDHVIANAQTRLSIDMAEDAPLVSINPGELQQVIINLVVNAVQAMGDRGALTITLQRRDQTGQSGAALIIADTGPGIPADKLASVFDPFFTTKLGEGTGLGLSVSQTLIQGAKGLISVRNRAEGGAEFTVWLPEDQGEQT